MARPHVRFSEEKTLEMLRECKRDNETWDDCLQRLAQLDRATRAPAE